MTPAELKSLRAELKCTTRELADAIGVEQETVLSWERGDTFPTKQWLDRMLALRARGPSAIVRRAKKGARRSPFDALRDPALWAVMRKLVAHPELLAQVKRLCDAVEDPADDP